MSNATGYRIVAPPQVSPGETTRVVAVLVGGSSLDASLTINVIGDLVSASPGGFVTITIAPGEFAGSVAFTALGLPGWRGLTATHSGGNAGMGDPPAVIVQAIGPGFVPPSGLRLTHLAMPAGTQPTWTPLTGGPSGKGHVIAVEVLGDFVPGPVTLTPSDGAGGQFLPESITVGDGRDPAYRPLQLIYYFPAGSGVQTVTLSTTGIPGPLAGSSISFDANL